MSTPMKTDRVVSDTLLSDPTYITNHVDYSALIPAVEQECSR